jgi:hypothetical protein
MAELKSMRWYRSNDGSYRCWSREHDLHVAFLITRTPYGKSGYTFEAHYRKSAAVGADMKYSKIPLSFSSRLKDTKACVDRFIEREL